MKKLLALIIVAGLLLTGTMAYAEGTVKADRQAKLSGIKDFKAEYKTQLDTIKANREELSKLRQEAASLYKEAKQRVKDLLKSEEDITQEQIDALKQSVDLLVADKKLLVETKGDIFKESVDLRVARRNKDAEAYKAALDEILSVQNTRIDSLNKVINDLKNVGVI